MKRVTASELHDLFSCAGFTDIFIESRSTPRQYGSVEEFMKQGMELGGADQLLNDVPDDIRRKIMTEIFEELGKKMTPDGITLGIGTLFAVATKSNESM